MGKSIFEAFHFFKLNSFVIYLKIKTNETIKSGTFIKKRIFLSYCYRRRYNGSVKKLHLRGTYVKEIFGSWISKL